MGKRPTAVVRRGCSVALALAMVTTATAACNRKTETQPAEPPPPEPILPTPSATGKAFDKPQWALQLPTVAVEAKVGDKVWATIPEPATELATVGVFTVDFVAGETATLIDKMGQKVRGVPGAAIHALGTGKLEAGELALCYSWTIPAVLGRVYKIVKNKKYIQYDWAGVTKVSDIEHAEPAIKGIAPLAHVGFPKGGTTSKGLLIALSETHGWVRTSSGHIEMHERDKLERLAITTKGYEKGDRVRAYRWAVGYEAGVIAKVVEPGLRYVVDLAEPHGDHPYFFADLVRVESD